MKTYVMNCASEDEAKRKACCNGVSDNCLASRCMAWREHHKENVNGSKETTSFGYCGLAGSPSS